MENIVFIYLIVGLLFSLFYTSIMDIDINNPDNEDGMVNIYLLFVTFVWPYYFIKYIIKYITNEK